MIRRLLSIRLKSTFLGLVGGKDKNGNPKPVSAGKVALYVLLFAFLAASLLFFVFTVTMSLAMVFIPFEADDIYFGLVSLSSLSVLFVLSIFETKSEIFDCKDNELLLSMPIKSGDIIISRIASVMIYNYIIEAVIMIPAVVSYIIAGGSAIGIAGSVLVFLTLPHLATALASGVGYLVALISAKMKNKTVVVMALYMLFLFAYMAAYTYLMENLDALIENIVNNFTDVAEKLSFVGIVGSVSLLNPIALIIYLLLSFCVSAAAYFVISKSFIYIATGSKTSAKIKYHAKKLEQKSLFSALVKKEFSKLFSSAGYMLNGGLGVIFMLLLGGFAIVKRGDFEVAVGEMLQIPLGVASELFAPMIIALIVFMSSMVMISSSALSLEGKSFWILKSMPIEPKTYLFAKAMPHIVIGAASGAITGLLLAIATSAPVYLYPFYLLIPALANVFFAFAGILLNVAFPKFEFTNEMQVVKQSMATFLSMMLGFLVGGAFFVLAIFGMSMTSAVVIVSLMTATLVILNVGAYLLIAGPASRRAANFN